MPVVLITDPVDEVLKKTLRAAGFHVKEEYELTSE